MLFFFFFCSSQNELQNEGNTNHFSELYSELGHYYVVLKTSKTYRENLTIIVVEMQKIKEIDKTDSKKNEILCRNGTIFKGRKNVWVNFGSDRNSLNIVMCRYKNNLFLKDSKIILILTESLTLLSKLVTFLGYIDVFFRRCIVMDETIVHN